MKRLRVRKKLKLAQLEAAQLKEVIEEEEAQKRVETKDTAERGSQENRVSECSIRNLDGLRCQGRTRP